MKTAVLIATLFAALLLVMPLPVQAGAFHGGLNLGYTYATADAAIDQPQLEILTMMGLRFLF